MVGTPSNAHVHFAVVRVGGVYKVLHTGRQWGRFDSQIDAVRAASRLAETQQRGENLSEIFVQDEWGWVSPWTVPAERSRAS